MGSVTFVFMAWEWARRLLGAKPDEFDPLGDRGENVAAAHLRKLGYRILIRNWESKFGEVDIIARDGKMLVFVEVKTRKDSDPEPEEQVNIVKQRQITKCSGFLSHALQQHPTRRPLRCRRRHLAAQSGADHPAY